MGSRVLDQPDERKPGAAALSLPGKSPPAGSTSILLDVHTHQIPLGAFEHARIEGVERTAQGISIRGQRFGLQKLWRPDELIAWLDANGIGRAWFALPPPAYLQWLDARDAERWHRSVSTEFDALAAARSGRLDYLQYLPLEHPSLALQLAREQLRRGRCLFTTAAAGHPGLIYTKPELSDLWALLAEARAFVFIHPGKCGDDRLSAHYLHNLLGNPYETALCALQLVLSGMMRRHSGIDFCLAHGGGLTAAALHRVLRGVAKKRPGLEDLTPEMVAEDTKRFYVDSVVYDAQMLELSARVFGQHRILFGSDWPFPIGLDDPLEFMQDARGALQRSICQDNALALPHYVR